MSEIRGPKLEKKVSFRERTKNFHMFVNSVNFSVANEPEDPRVVEMVLLGRPHCLDAIRPDGIPIWKRGGTCKPRRDSERVCEKLLWLQT